jgi:cytochrome c peroxidase
MTYRVQLPFAAVTPRLGVLATALCLAATAGAQSSADSPAARAAARAEARSHLKMDPAALAILQGLPDKDPAKKQKEDLGRQIFNDSSLSEPQGQSCESCHMTDRAFSSPKPTSAGANAALFGSRNAPQLTYTMFTPPLQSGGDEGPASYFGGQFRDGRADFLEDQVHFPMLNPLEMGNASGDAVMAKVAVASYAELFKQIYGANVFADPATAFVDLADAVATFERSPEFRRFDSKFDAYRKGNATLTDSEARGLAIFNDPARANCALCHLTGADPVIGPRPLLTDFGYDNIGVPRNPDNKFYKMASQYNPDGKKFIDVGLGNVVPMYYVKGQFKSPSLRNVAVTGPYMHNGYFKTLRGVLDFYNTRDVRPRCASQWASEADAQAQGCWPGPEEKNNVNAKDLGNLKLSDQDIDDIIAFLGTLTDGWTPEKK